VEFVLSLPVLVGFVLYYLVRGRVQLDWELVFFPLGMLLQFVLLVGLGLLLAPVTVLATDMKRVVRIVLRFMFYLSPVLYGTHAVPEFLRVILVFNPLNGILSLYRGGLFARSVSWIDVGVSAGMSVALFVIGFWTFSRLERTVLKEI
jgi:ABC-2 type transport system permease protein